MSRLYICAVLCCVTLPVHVCAGRCRFTMLKSMLDELLLVAASSTPVVMELPRLSQGSGPGVSRWRDISVLAC